MANPALRRRLLQALPAWGLSYLGLPAWGKDPLGGDPLGSLLWPDLRREFVGRAPCTFTDKVTVRGPAQAEDSMHVPIYIDARPLAEIERIRRIRVLVDRNPIRHVLDFEPGQALPVMALRLRMQQASPVRALVETDAGRWHVAGTWVQAAGGGCTVAGVTRADGSWSKTLNQVQARFFASEIEGCRRLRLRIMHPMDTGFVPGVPAFLLSTLSLSDAQGQPCWRMALHEPVSENPLMTFELPTQVKGPLRLRGEDNNGNLIDCQVPA